MTASLPKVPQQTSFELDGPPAVADLAPASGQVISRKHSKLPKARSTVGRPPQLRLLRRAAVERMTGLSRSSIYRLVAARAFPNPVRLSAHAVAWIESEIEQWIFERVSASRKDAQS
jgi:prophage regulatory protein